MIIVSKPNGYRGTKSAAKFVLPKCPCCSQPHYILLTSITTALQHVDLTANGHLASPCLLLMAFFIIKN
jgi:hypothetical protein